MKRDKVEGTGKDCEHGVDSGYTLCTRAVVNQANNEAPTSCYQGRVRGVEWSGGGVGRGGFGGWDWI